MQCRPRHGKNELRLKYCNLEYLPLLSACLSAFHSIIILLMFNFLSLTSEGCCSTQQIQDQALPEVLDQRLLRLRTSLQLHPQGAGDPESRQLQRPLRALRREDRVYAAHHVQVSFENCPNCKHLYLILSLGRLPRSLDWPR